MANNIDVTPGTGKTVASEEISSVQYQKVKLVDPTAASTAGIGIAANPMQVSLANTGANGTPVVVDGSGVTQPVSAALLPLPTGAATLAEQQTQTASLSVLDDWDESDRAKINPIVGQAGVTGGSGTVDAKTQRVTLATDVALPAGTNNIGDVDVLSSALPTGASTLAEQQTQTASLSVLDDWDESDRAKVNPIAGQAGVQGNSGAVTALTQRVVLATDVALPTGDNNIGNVDVVSQIPGTGATNLGKAEDGGHTSGDTGVFALGVRNDTPNAAVTGSDADYSQLSTYKDGSLRTALCEEDFAALGSNHVKKYFTNSGAVTDGIIWSPAAGKRWYITDIFINISAAATITLEDDKAAGDEVVRKAELAANSGWSHHFGTPLFSGEDAADLLITTSAGNVYVTVTGYEI